MLFSFMKFVATMKPSTMGNDLLYGSKFISLSDINLVKKQNAIFCTFEGEIISDLFRNLLPDPEMIPLTAEKRQNIIDAFYLDVFIVLRQFGILEDLLICGNRSDHLSGNVLAMYKEVNSAVAAQNVLNGQFYAGRKLLVTFAPIARISNAICRRTDGECPSGDQCAFVHPLNPSKHVMNECFPRGMKAYALPFRTVKQQKIWDTPADLLYGQTKMRKDED